MEDKNKKPVRDEELLNEVEGIFSKEDKEEVKKHLTYDNKQYSLRIPKKFIEEAEINKDKDFFKICLHYPPVDSNEKPKITIDLIRENEEKSKT